MKPVGYFAKAGKRFFVVEGAATLSAGAQAAVGGTAGSGAACHHDGRLQHQSRAHRLM